MRPGFGEIFSHPELDEVVLFYHFIKRGLALPTSIFLRGLLYTFSLEMHHLNPNSIAHLAIFVHLCEAFLRIEPHWDLFRYLYYVKPQPGYDNPYVVGGAGLQLKQKISNRSIQYQFPNNIITISQAGKTNGSMPLIPIPLPKPTLVAPVARAEWKQVLSASEMVQVNELFELIELIRLPRN